MAYAPNTDFLALLRQTGSGVEPARVPGLDYVVAAMARAGLFSLSVGQTAPIVNQASTVWLQPALPSWTAEGVVRLWNSLTQQYEVATAALWSNVLAPTGYLFQSATAGVNAINSGVSLLAIERAAPSSTTLTLPTLAGQFITGRILQIVDWSTAVANHVITLVPAGGATIMKQPAWSLLSTADQLAGVSLRAAPDLNGWVIAP